MSTAATFHVMEIEAINSIKDFDAFILAVLRGTFDLYRETSKNMYESIQGLLQFVAYEPEKAEIDLSVVKREITDNTSGYVIEKLIADRIDWSAETIKKFEFMLIVYTEFIQCVQWEYEWFAVQCDNIVTSEGLRRLFPRMPKIYRFLAEEVNWKEVIGGDTSMSMPTPFTIVPLDCYEDELTKVETGILMRNIEKLSPAFEQLFYSLYIDMENITMDTFILQFLRNINKDYTVDQIIDKVFTLCDFAYARGHFTLDEYDGLHKLNVYNQEFAPGVPLVKSLTDIKIIAIKNKIIPIFEERADKLFLVELFRNVTGADLANILS